jgi:hypothetical protein
MIVRKTNIPVDIKVFYVTAESFPKGIQSAHDRLHALVPFTTERKYFGLSRPENNSGIVYRAATEETYDNESKKYDCETLVIKKGNYASIIVQDFRKDTLSITRAFETLLDQPGLDPQGYCVEYYSNTREEVQCMIRLAD